MNLDYEIIDAYTDKPLEGNPVAVYENNVEDLDDNLMQKIALEMHLSETTFVNYHKGDEYDVFVKIFTPVNELDFAGHPLLGSALSIFRKLQKNDLLIKTNKGIFKFYVEQLNNSNRKYFVKMEQPLPNFYLYDKQESLLNAIGKTKSTLPIYLYDVGARHVFIGVENEEELYSLDVNYQILKKHENMALNCFCKANDGKWHLRMFSPAYGVVEDFATGSATGPLALHLAKHSIIEYGHKIEIFQGYKVNKISRMYGLAIKKNEDIFIYSEGEAILLGKGTLNL